MDDEQPDPAEVAAWREITTIRGLGDLTAQWLEGQLRYGGPNNGGYRPDHETASLVPALAAMNRAGFATEFSQPGEVRGSWLQRAAVSGFCDARTAEVLEAACLATELICLVYPPGVDVPVDLPVSRDGGRAYTGAGMSVGVGEIVQLWAGTCSYELAQALANSHQVTIIDPAWGRDDLLWPAVLQALDAYGRLRQQLSEDELAELDGVRR